MAESMWNIMREGILDKFQRVNPVTIGFPSRHRCTAAWQLNELLDAGAYTYKLLPSYIFLANKWL